MKKLSVLIVAGLIAGCTATPSTSKVVAFRDVDDASGDVRVYATDTTFTVYSRGDKAPYKGDVATARWQQPNQNDRDLFQSHMELDRAFERIRAERLELDRPRVVGGELAPTPKLIQE